MSVEDYSQLLDWTAHRSVAGKRGVTPSDTPAILQRLGLEPDVGCELVRDFGTLFSLVAGRPPPSAKLAHMVAKRAFTRGQKLASS